MQTHRTRRHRRSAVIARTVEHSLDRSGALLLVATAVAVAVVLLLALAATPAHAARTTTVNGDYALERARSLELDIPFGELHVKGVDGDRVRVHVEATCENDDCSETFKDLRLVSSNRNGTLHVKLEGKVLKSEWDSPGEDDRDHDAAKDDGSGITVRHRSDRSDRGERHGHDSDRNRHDADGDLTIVVEVPRALQVDLDMGAGEIEIEGLREDLSIDLGAGDITVRMPAQRVGSVDVTMAVGETTIHEGGRTREYTRVLGGPIRWRNGKGDAGIDVNVGAGQVDVTLE